MLVEINLSPLKVYDLAFPHARMERCQGNTFQAQKHSVTRIGHTHYSELFPFCSLCDSLSVQVYG